MSKSWKESNKAYRKNELAGKIGKRVKTIMQGPSLSHPQILHIDKGVYIYGFQEENRKKNKARETNDLLETKWYFKENVWLAKVPLPPELTSSYSLLPAWVIPTTSINGKTEAHSL